MKDARDQKIPYKIYLSESEMPKTWYNVRADMKNKPADDGRMVQLIGDDRVLRS